MLVLEYKIKAKQGQYKAIDEAIRTVQFIRNKCLRYWINASKDAHIDRFAMNKYSTELRNEFTFVKNLNSMAVQASAERAWLAIGRFYDNCKIKKTGKKGFPRFQKDNRSIEYKTSGWKLLCKSNDLVAYEDLKVSNLLKNHWLAKSITDASWCQFRQWLEYFATKFGKSAIAVPPHYTSQECSQCNRVVKKSLSTRTHVCQCGCILHRDINAAINILLLAKSRGGHPQSNAKGLATSILLGATLVEQVARVNLESPYL